MVYSQEYDRLNYDPPAPVVEITVTNSNFSELSVNHGYKIDTYLLTMRIGPFSIFGIEAIALEQNSEAIIGRDTLNQLQVILDGLSNTVTISQ